METRTDSAIKNLSKKIKNLPYKRKLKNKNFQSGFLGELRNYQKEGVLFLESLFEIGLGGILADDMGLGKTIQCLTFLDRILSQKKAKLILIVGPLASISVWKKESEKFFKELNLILWHGSDRKKNPLPNKGIILTTYGTLSRDFDDWKDHYTFDITILDEAQNLKNYRSITSHATREIKSRSYYCLTGTPLENNLMDLWSLFDLIFPGYLGKKDAFKKIYSDSNTNSHLLLKEKIEPFLLRRTKENVLTELPSKTEILVPVAMTETQKKFYEEARKQAIIELANAGRDYLIKLLPHLMRLRRIACHPEIGNPLKTNPLQSGKFQHIQDVIEEVVGSSSGILIFSQFTDILKICGKLLEKLGHDYYYLDGSTKIKDREQFVREFQEGQKHIFLISLKAGGTALTLHRADTVMHLDPWWNPAIERQASDRAHRIGQKKKVFVYKLYSEDSIEEKVLELQRKKKDIFDSIFEGNFTTSSQITRQELQELLEW
ncbi:MAG: DEAD/DEAH box helicase [Leptospiraceae bacterium]|nr:DEAD/DEAH box helicase [Leptospiraceae bacterium]NUM42430.1 DEAD/DEAH box helicase [Leptospiraceae bacterium]